MLRMNLDQYLSQPNAIASAELARRVGVTDPAQIRQWRHGYANRKPNVDNCVAIELATAGVVTVEEMQSDLPWARIPDPNWPHSGGRPVLDPASKSHQQSNEKVA